MKDAHIHHPFYIKNIFLLIDKLRILGKEVPPFIDIVRFEC